MDAVFGRFTMIVLFHSVFAFPRAEHAGKPHFDLVMQASGIAGQNRFKTTVGAADGCGVQPVSAERFDDIAGVVHNDRLSPMALAA
ncbi:MAG: hypothetical protein IJA56_05150 [Clostridia bacterium]|nr:hypothetical protein [Clostridia bacterium]